MAYIRDGEWDWQRQLPPEYNPQIQDITHQLRLSDLLRQQSLQSPEGQMVSGHYVAPSITQYMAKLLQGYYAGENDKSANKAMGDMYQNYKQKNADLGTQFTQLATPQVDLSQSETPSEDANGNTTYGPTPMSVDRNKLTSWLLQNPEALQNPVIASLAPKLISPDQGFSGIVPAGGQAYHNGQLVANNPRQSDTNSNLKVVGNTLLSVEGGKASPLYTAPDKAKDQWGEPYQLGGQWVQTNSATGEIRQAIHQPMASGGNPYFTPVQTDQGIMRFNARTGAIEPMVINGKPVVGAANSPSLQGDIARSRTAGKAQGEAQGALADAQSSLPQLEATINQLKALSNTMTYTGVGRGINASRTQLGMKPTQGAIDREKYINTARDVLFPQLRATFGAQFTVKEGEALLQTLGDPNKTPEERNATLDAFIDQKKQHLQSLQRRAGQVMPKNEPMPLPASGSKVIDFRELP